VHGLTDQQLIYDYAENRSETAFTELVRRQVDFVYSAVLRMVRDRHLAEDVTQGVFVALAKNATQLTNYRVLSAWLHRTAQNLAANAVRADVRRRAREQEAAAMTELVCSEPDSIWEHIAPDLDNALEQLSEPDREAVLLRYFERKSAHEMAQTLGVTDEAAQKRVSRAIERLREFFAKRGIAVGTSGLVLAITANAVQAAPAGLVLTISTAAAIASKAVVTTATATATKVIAATTLQKTVIGATLALAVGAGVYETRHASTLRGQLQDLHQRQAQLAGQIENLTRERDDAARQLAVLRDQKERVDRAATELLRLRGEVGVLRRENEELQAALKNVVQKPAQPASGPTAPWASKDPESQAIMRELIPQLELVYQAAMTNNHPATVIVGRVNPTNQSFGGKWAMLYSFADGRSVFKLQPDGEFDAWEKKLQPEPGFGPWKKMGKGSGGRTNSPARRF